MLDNKIAVVLKKIAMVRINIIRNDVNSYHCNLSFLIPLQSCYPTFMDSGLYIWLITELLIFTETSK